MFEEVRCLVDGTVHGPAMTAGRLISRGYTNAEKALSANYARGDVVAFHRPYKRLGVGHFPSALRGSNPVGLFAK